MSKHKTREMRRNRRKTESELELEFETKETGSGGGGGDSSCPRSSMQLCSGGSRVTMVVAFLPTVSLFVESRFSSASTSLANIGQLCSAVCIGAV